MVVNDPSTDRRLCRVISSTFGGRSIIMQIDLWQRRAGWLALVAVILFSGLVAQTRLLADDESDGKPAPKAEAEMKLKQWKEQVAQQAADAQEKAQREMDVAKEKMQAQLEKAKLENAKALYEKQLSQYQWQNQLSPFGASGKYWIGVECREASPELRAQLGLKDSEGLVVMHVAEDSPAAKAGIKQHDVIVAAGQGGTPHRLSNVPELIKVMDQSEGKEAVPLKIIRGGKEQVLDVTPAERPDATAARLWMQPGPGILYSGNAIKAPPLPDNVSVSIMRQGSKPAKITVTRGDEKWELSDGELDKLPEDLRSVVQGMLGGGPMTITIGPGGKVDAYNKMVQLFAQPQKTITGTGTLPPGAPQPPQPPKEASVPQGPKARPVDPEALMRRLDELDRRLEQLQQELRGTRDGAGDPMPRMRQPGQAEGDASAPRPPKGARPMRDEPRDATPPPPAPRGL
jgi:hypothetical protein